MNKCMLTQEEEFVASIATSIFSSNRAMETNWNAKNCVEAAIDIIEATKKQVRAPLNDVKTNDEDRTT